MEAVRKTFHMVYDVYIWDGINDMVVGLSFISIIY